MPLLKRETEISSQEIFEDGRAPWRVAYARSRQEKAFARYLQPLGVQFYLPYREKVAERRGRRLVSHLPLFPGYVFFRGDAAERATALRSHLLVTVLEVADQRLLNHELSQLRQLQLSGASLVPVPELAPGEAVRVIDGPFHGYTGTILRGADGPRLVVAITMLRKAVAVGLSRESVVPLGSRLRSGQDTRSAVA